MKSRTYVAYPKGYPYILYAVKSGSDTKYVIAATEEQATRITHVAKAKAFPASVKALVDENGHKKTNELLRQFGMSWICKQGKVFYQSRQLQEIK